VTTLFEAYQASMEPATVKALIPIIQKEMPKTPQPIEKGYDQSADFHLKTGLVAKAPSYKDIVPDAWIAKALKG
jgi:NitT/TauT family transport system substrate-binding protein